MLHLVPGLSVGEHHRCWGESWRHEFFPNYFVGEGGHGVLVLSSARIKYSSCLRELLTFVGFTFILLFKASFIYLP